MTRTLFFLTILAAVLAACSAILIRIELAYPGVSALFQNSDGPPDGHKFIAVASFHSGFSFLGVILLGTTMSSAARSKRATLSSMFVWIGIILSGLVFIWIVFSTITTSPSVEIGNGWSLYPPLSSSTRAFGLLAETLSGTITIDPILSDLNQILLVLAAAMITLGAYAMIATLPSFGWAGILGFILVTPTTILTIAAIQADHNMVIGAPFLIAFLPIVALASIHLIDDAPSWLLFLTCGFILTLVGLAFLATQTQMLGVKGTMLDIANFYLFPLGISFFALPAVILYDRDVDLPVWGTILSLTAITKPFLLCILFLTTLGFAGMPMHYVDYADGLAGENLALTANVIFFVCLYLATIIAIRRVTRQT